MAHDSLLALHDHMCGIKLEAGQLNGCVAGVCVLPNATAWSIPIPEVIHVVAHTEGFDRTHMPEAFFTANAAGKKVIVLHVASGGFVQHQCNITQHADADFVWLSQKDSHIAYRKVSEWLPEFMRLDFDSAKKLVEISNTGDRAHASAYETDYAHFLDIILPGRIENRLAFRLLCEAYKFKKIDKQSNCEGIEIHAPEGIGQWLDPFGKTPDEGNAIEEVAGMIGSGEIKKKAKAVLEAVSGNGTALNNAVENFLKEVAEPNI